MREERLHYELVEGSEEIREAHDSENPGCDDKVLVGFPSGGLALESGCHGGFVCEGSRVEVMGLLSSIVVSQRQVETGKGLI